MNGIFGTNVHGAEVAFEIALSMRNPSHQRERVRSGIEEWARRDPDAALLKLNELEDQGMMAVAIQSLGAGWAANDLGDAVSYADQIDSQKMRSKFLAGIAEEAVKGIEFKEPRGQEEIAAIVEAIGDHSLRRHYQKVIEKRLEEGGE